MNYTEDKLIIIAEDNGKGFDALNVSANGIGLNNMKKRGHLINADISIQSVLNKGTQLTITQNKI